MMSERMIRIAPIVVTIVTGAFVATLVPTPVLVTIVLGITAAVTVWLWVRGKSTQGDRR